MAVSNAHAAKIHVEKLKIKDCLDGLFAERKLKPNEMRLAADQYRSFLYEVWMNRFSGKNDTVESGKLVDIVWKKHIDSGPLYTDFCIDFFGEHFHFGDHQMKSITQNRQAGNFSQELSPQCT